VFFRTLNMNLKFPDVGTVLDYFIEPLTGDVVTWQSRVEGFSSSAPVASLGAVVVPTADTVRMTYLLNYLVRNNRPAMLVGSAGTGKTVLIKDYLDSLSATDDTFRSVTINMNFYTDAYALQNQLEQNIDKRSGKTYGPTGGKLIYFVDDLNLPFVETYGTQTPIALMRQHIDSFNHFISEGDCFRKVVASVNMQQWKWYSGRIKCFPCQMSHYN
jgi:dynein heavy chain